MVLSIKHWWTKTCRFCRVVDKALSVLLRVLVLILSLMGAYAMMVWYQSITLWFSDAFPVVEFGVGEVSSPTARPDDVLIFYQPFKKNRNCYGTVRRVMIGDCGFFLLSERPAWVQAPWAGRLTYAVQIPSEAIPGNCGFQILAMFVCNPLDLIEPRMVSSTPIEFRVLRYDE